MSFGMYLSDNVCGFGQLWEFGDMFVYLGCVHGFMDLSQCLWVCECINKYLKLKIRSWNTDVIIIAIVEFVAVQPFSHVRLSAIPWAAACQASLSFTVSWSLLKLMSIDSVMPSNLSSSVVPISSCLQSLPASGYFPVSQFVTSGGQSIGASSAESVLPMNIQDWFPLGLIDLISLQTLKNLLQHHSSKASVLQCSAFFMVSLSHPYMTTGKTTALTIYRSLSTK